MTEGNEERKLEPFVRHETEENQVELSADEVLSAIAEGRDVDIEYAVIEGDLDIEKIRDDLAEEDGRPVISCDVKIRDSTIKGETDFSHTTFSGGANFGGATFSGEIANFRDATFTGAADFALATFTGAADFSAATFSGAAYFLGTTFSGDAGFSQAHMERPANFSYVRFKENTVFVGLWNDVLRRIFRFECVSNCGGSNRPTNIELS